MSEEQGQTTRSSTHVAVVLFLVTTALYVATAGYHRIHIDVMSANVGSWRIASTGAPWIDDLDVDVINHTKVDLFTTTNEGHTVISRSPGVVAASLPAYLARQVATGSGTSAQDFSNAPGAVTAALVTALTVLLMWGTLLQIVSRRTATAAAVVFAFATPVWSVAADGMWTHTLTLLGIAGLAWGAVRDRWLLVGVFGGVAAWGRLHTVLIAAGVAIACSIAHRRPRIALEVGGAGAVLMGAAALWSHWLYGSWIPTGGYSSNSYVDRVPGSSYDFTSTWHGLLSNEAALWVSPDRGILVWTPVVAFLLPFLVRSWEVQPVWARALLLSGVAYTLLQGWVAPFHGGDGIYGYRHGLEFLACATPALTIAAARVGRRSRRALTALVGVQLAAFTLGGFLNKPTLTFGKHWHDNAFFWGLREVPAMWVLVAFFVGATFLVSRMYLSDTGREPAVSVGGQG